MPELEDFIKPKKKKSVGLEVSGAFECQECGQVANTASYDSDESVLTWECGSGHSSRVVL